MNVKITKEQLKIFRKGIELGLFGNDECNDIIEYVNFGFSWKMVWINLETKRDSDYRQDLYSRITSSDCKTVTLRNIVTEEEFQVSPDDLRLSKESKKLYIFKKVYNDKIFPNFPKIDILLSFIRSKEIKESLKRAFSDDWSDRSETHIAGVRDILPIEGDPNGWSIVNFFNSKKSVKERIKLFLIRDYRSGEFEIGNNKQESVVNWMTELFKDVDGDDMRELVDIQEKSINTFFAAEYGDAKKIQERLHPNKGNDEDIVISGFGTILDIERGVDVTIDGITYQMKPLSTITVRDGKYYVSVGYSNAGTYRKNNVDRMAFVNKDNVYVFENNGNKPEGNIYEFSVDEMIYPRKTN